MVKVITEIAAQKHNRQRLNISLDGAYAFSLDRLTAAWLKPGRKLSDAEIEALLKKDALESAYQRALHFLSFRSRSQAEMEGFLLGKGFTPAIVEPILLRLNEEGLLNDERFSADWIENRVTFRPRSQNQLRAELRHKGVAESTAEQALTTAGLDESQLALAAGRKMLHRYETLPWETFRARLGNALLRRGFTFTLVNATLKQLWAESHNQTQENLLENRGL